MAPITGTGKRTADGRFMEDPRLYRTIAAPGDGDILPATIDAIDEVINTKYQVLYPDAGDDVTSRRWAKDNQLHLQIVIPSTVTSFDLHVFGTMVGGDIPETADRWSYVFVDEGYDRSQVVTIQEPPHGQLKVLLVNIVGSGNVNVYYSLTD
jgi:hypothetical protein